jgi:hypothetical protein
MSAPHSFGPGCEECEGYCLELAKLARECGGIRGGSFDAVKTWEFTEEGLTKFATRLSAPRMEAVKGGWQPIETAPKDGRCVLLSCEDYTDVGFWHDGSQCYGHRGGAGWFSEDERPNLLTARNIHPTHWQPFPEPFAAPPFASLPGEGGCDCDRPEWCKANRNCAREWIFSGASAGGEADKTQEKA